MRYIHPLLQACKARQRSAALMSEFPVAIVPSAYERLVAKPSASRKLVPYYDIAAFPVPMAWTGHSVVCVQLPLLLGLREPLGAELR